MNVRALLLSSLAMAVSPLVLGHGPQVNTRFKIHVVDAETGRGVPLVELRTVNSLRLVTDSNGLVAFDEPGLMGHDVYFHVQSHGYELPADEFGYRGVALHAVAGGEGTVKIKRLNIAERLCRLTGQGIYRDSVLLQQPAPLRDPVLNGGVLGQDTAQAEIYKGKMMWFWGDTDRTSFPLGNFHTTGAIATFPRGHDDASVGLDYKYFTGADGFVRAMVPREASLPVWVSGMVVLGSGNNETMYAYYSQMKSLNEIAESGYVRWSDAKQCFDTAQVFTKERGWRHLESHTVRLKQGYVACNLPVNVRVPADPVKLLNSNAYEAFTCIGPDGGVQRDGNGKPDYRWQKSLPPIDGTIEDDLIKKGSLKPEEAHFLPQDEKGTRILTHGGSVHWNEYRKRWIMIFTRKWGKDSALGEIYYSEAPEATGPFRRAVKILTHDKYTFYNPVHHAFLDRDGGKTIFLEGTYTAEFSGNTDKTPLYNYNQILYRLDLSDPRMAFAETP